MNKLILLKSKKNAKTPRTNNKDKQNENKHPAVQEYNALNNQNQVILAFKFY